MTKKYYSFKELSEALIEASITTTTDLSDYPIDKQAKEFNLKVKKMRGKGDGFMGDDLMTLTGSEKDLVGYFAKYMGANKKAKFKDLEQQFGESVELDEDGHTEVESVKNRLSAIKRNAEELMSIVGDQDYPEWWLAKLIKADDYLDTAKDFLQNKKDQGEV